MTSAAHAAMTGRAGDVVLLCNPRAGGRWRILADVLESEEARDVRRIVTDEIDDIRDALAGIGRRVELLCIYGGDGTIHRVINELLRGGGSPLPRIALLGGGTMNVTARWCGMRRSPGHNFRQVMRAYRADRLLWREVPLLAVTQQTHTRYGFTFGAGPLVRVLEHFESSRKSRLRAILLGLRSVMSAVSGVPRADRPLLRELSARITVDGQALPYDRWAAVFANVTGTINPFVEPFTAERTRETFHFLAYAISSREFALMAPLLARARLPLDARALLQPISAWQKAVLALVAGDGLAPDPRYVNQPAAQLVLETDEPHYTIDGEVFASLDRRFEVRLGPPLHLAAMALRPERRKPRRTIAPAA